MWLGGKQPEPEVQKRYLLNTRNNFCHLPEDAKLITGSLGDLTQFKYSLTKLQDF
jgi:hypothetical protein